VEAENAYTQAMMKDTEDLQTQLYAEMLGRIKQTDLSVPVPRDGYFYYTRTEEGKQYAIYCRKRESLEAVEEILLDCNFLAEGRKYFHIGVFAPSPNHRLLAYSVDFDGDEIYTLRIKDLETGALLADEIPNTSVTVEGVTAFEDYLVVEERELGLTRLRIQRVSSGELHYVEFPEPVYSAALTGNAEFATRRLRFTYSSLVTPNSVFDYDMETRERELKKQQEVLGGYDQSRYQSERIFAPAPSGAATAPDGAQVPISLVYRKGVPHEGGAPLLLYGYGAYGLSMEPVFSSDRLSLLDRGIVFAMAHVRGGGDLGKTWHEDGRLLKKKNTFTDFIACAECLIARGYTTPNRLAIEGRSAGGLLIGAVMNLRPDLFAAAIAGVPFVDALNTMLDPSLPLTIGEYEEWGNPSDKVYYDYIESYAPYENVKAQQYPAVLITAGLNDPRVSYWEPAKWAARLRKLKTDSNLLLLKTNMGSGHFGASGRYEYLKEKAFHYAFLLKVLEILSS
jgi:oligopeptidase B